ncbi:D-glycero-beta-D-manno-heptose 1-phosphate adenylyltransferase [Arthrobacter sp. zg-ZUI100]|uniref:D-glycero-beta-D-manno-heptose 1-phosphate adenylyltransferase n=1 Tax=Arthrobacter jiangjiafuii TaxID=2817475 RepID=UPI001AEE5E3D|nr:D-glycero-beta-D-manno-heptose 1-phosphate adenylyltransferase [Arthrobacter jiangjiafuii]
MNAPQDLSRLRSLAPWLPGRLAGHAPRIAVIGDVMLDGWFSGTTDRFCREAPAPVVDLVRRDYAPGGAANTAMNLQALGARVRLAGLVGEDEAGERLRQLLGAAGIDLGLLASQPGARTATKYRILASDQVLLRLDDGGKTVPPDAQDRLAAALPAWLADTDAVVVCDYGSGLLHGPVRDALAALAGGRLTVVDAHDPALWKALAPDVVTPNAQEAASLLGLRLGPDSDRAELLGSRGPDLLRAAGARAVVVTLDREGTVLLTEGGSHRTWARPATEKQASGAGDTFVACLTVARAAGLPLSTAADLAQNAADIVVRRAGTSVCTTLDLELHLTALADTALSPSELASRIAADRAAGKRIVLTNGCFDVLHRGHTRYLNQAKALGDVLVVALNGDASVTRLKGPGRPINPVHDRAGVIAALSCVDYVTVFDTDTPIPLIEALRPDIYAKGGDYSPEMLQETPVVRACGGTVRILDYVPDHSTSAVVQRIRAAQGQEGNPGAAARRPLSGPEEEAGARR